jgi:hypothetical protein
VTTVIIAGLVLVLWSMWRTLRAERGGRLQQMYMFIEAAEDAGKSEEWIREALDARGYDYLPADPWPHDIRAVGIYRNTLRAWRESKLSAKEMRIEYRKRGWPIPPALRGGLVFDENDNLLYSDNDPPPSEE